MENLPAIYIYHMLQVTDFEDYYGVLLPVRLKLLGPLQMYPPTFPVYEGVVGCDNWNFFHTWRPLLGLQGRHNDNTWCPTHVNMLCLTLKYFPVLLSYTTSKYTATIFFCLPLRLMYQGMPLSGFLTSMDMNILHHLPYFPVNSLQTLFFYLWMPRNRYDPIHWVVAFNSTYCGIHIYHIPVLGISTPIIELYA